MITRQAILKTALLPLLLGLSACTTTIESTPTSTVTIPPPTATITASPTAIPPTPTATPLACLTEPGQVKEDVVQVTNPPQKFLIYLPPCYETQTDKKYPVLYLLNGLTYNEDQWVRLGVPGVADQLIHSNEAEPFIVVFPDDPYWNLPPGDSFGIRLIDNLIPYVDANYRSIANRDHRALGGLSRGGGWAIKLGFEHPELFGYLGLHSPAIFKDNAPEIEGMVKAIPEESRPRLWFDIGDHDRELGPATLLEDILTRNNYLHEFYLFSGDHSEIYWSAHVETYLRWYTTAWSEPAEQ